MKIISLEVGSMFFYGSKKTRPFLVSKFFFTSSELCIVILIESKLELELAAEYESFRMETACSTQSDVVKKWSFIGNDV